MARNAKNAQEMSRSVACAASLLFGSLLFSSAANAACEDLAKFPLPGGRIISAVSVAQNDPIDISIFHIKLPAPLAFCRVAATLIPSADSTILAEVWLPEAVNWNGKFLGSGNGGFGGTVSSPMLDMRKAVARGYATAGNDLGHETTTLAVDGTWAIGHPEKLKDFAFRADHVTAEFAKSLIAAYYGHPPKYSYFRGCSNGGHEALMEAQKYPADYDGIIAGAPANSWTHLMTNFLWNETALNATPESRIPDSKLAIIQSAVLDKCDRLDGVKDDVINDPRKCRFDPKVLLCKAGDAPDCLTQPQIDALRKIYGGPVDP
ncbi:MAG: tannase/feruloyl esterase family alpha/beta hydrolase, partial [Candidatus Binataceae bacterium]